MYHPLYPVAMRMVGQPVNVHHINGSIHRGILQSVAPHGIYVLPYGRQLMSGSEAKEDDFDLVYSPAAYFGFGALAGLSLGALAGAYYW